MVFKFNNATTSTTTFSTLDTDLYITGKVNMSHALYTSSSGSQYKPFKTSTIYVEPSTSHIYSTSSGTLTTGSILTLTLSSVSASMTGLLFDTQEYNENTSVTTNTRETNIFTDLSPFGSSETSSGTASVTTSFLSISRVTDTGSESSSTTGSISNSAAEKSINPLKSRKLIILTFLCVFPTLFTAL